MMIKQRRVFTWLIICVLLILVTCNCVKKEIDIARREITVDASVAAGRDSTGGALIGLDGEGTGGALTGPDGEGTGGALTGLDGENAGETSAVSDAEGNVADGKYQPKTFTWTGGSGKVSITCSEINVSGGEAVATITFSSPNYSYVRTSGQQIEGEYTENTSTFKVPVQLDKDTEIIGCTTAMSRPHEISYSIYVSLKENNRGTKNQGIDGKSVGQPQTLQDGKELQSDEELREKVKASIDTGAESWWEIPSVPGLSYDHEMKLEYAKCFKIYYYKDGYKLISVIDGSKYLLVPEGKAEPRKLPQDITVIKQPVHNIYLAATSAMSLFEAIGQIDSVKYTGTDVSGWDIDAPIEAIKSGRMTFAGKYSAPDYEMLIAGDCDLAIESTMILHNPEAKEKLEAVGIPVFTDWSSYEKTAMGRAEWARLYAAILNEETAAETFIQKEKAESQIEKGFPKTNKTVAFFYINSKGLAVIRNSDDYISRMIRDGGGINVFENVATKGHGTTSEISMEELYDAAADADYLVYNGTIDTSVSDVEDVLRKNPIIENFKALEEGNVYLVDRKFYQSTDKASEFAGDINRMLSGNDKDMIFLVKLK